MFHLTLVLVIVLVLTVVLPDGTRLGGTILLAGSGIAALLAGLSGKPRPTGYAAVLLYISGWASITAGG
jgi:hypothetical protein